VYILRAVHAISSEKRSVASGRCERSWTQHRRLKRFRIIAFQGLNQTRNRAVESTRVLAPLKRRDLADAVIDAVPPDRRTSIKADHPLAHSGAAFGEIIAPTLGTVTNALFGATFHQVAPNRLPVSVGAAQ
jgi:hypothetical protein